MSDNNSNNNSGNVSHSDPIPIASSRTGRNRSASVSSASSGSASSTFDLPTPPSGTTVPQRVSIPSPGSSPILSYFLAQSPTKSPGTNTFPFKRAFGTAPVLEVDEDDGKEVPVAAHTRRASTHITNRFSQQPQQLPESHNERGTGLLRRLSLSSTAFVKPQFDSFTRSPPSPPPNSAVSSTPKGVPFSTKPRRSATINIESGRPRRAPSPMGERILKGHFDGFN